MKRLIRWLTGVALRLVPVRIRAFILNAVFEEQSNLPRTSASLVTETLDGLLGRRPHHGATLIKLDVQGSELEVLKGGVRALQQAEVVLLETSLLAYNRGAPLFSDVVRFMDDHGFCSYDICSLTRRAALALEEPDDTLVQTDLLFVKKSSPWRPTFFRFRAK